MRIIVTGGADGVGRATAQGLAVRGHRVVLGCGNTSEGERAASEMEGDVEVRRLDLADLASVRTFAAAVDGVDVLVNSAEVREQPLRRTHAGFEYHMGVNHLGHFALTCLLGDRITNRIVAVSATKYLASRIDLADLNWRRRPYSNVQAYAQSKLANLLFVDELARRGVRAYVADPGTEDIGGPPFEQAGSAFSAHTTVDAVSTTLPNGSYLTPHYNEWGRRTRGTELARRLWDLSAKLTDCDWRGETSMPLLW